MLTNSKCALSVALVLATASAAIAAPMDSVRHYTAIQRQARAGTYCVLVYQCAKLFKLTDAQRAAYESCFGKTAPVKSGYPGSCYESDPVPP